MFLSSNRGFAAFCRYPNESTVTEYPAANLAYSITTVKRKIRKPFDLRILAFY